MSVYYTCLWLLLSQLCVLGAARTVVERSNSIEFRSDYTFSQEAAGWFKLHHVPLDWHTARIQCYHEGAVLASPLNADLWSALTTVLMKANLDSTLVYSGVSATFNDGVYSSVEGVPLGQLHFEWGKGQLNNLDGHEQCLAYYTESDKLTVHNENCTRLLPYVCYRPASIPDEVTDCGTVDKEYKLQACTGHCYKFHAHALPWPLAARVCQAEGGYLVDINSQHEANLLVDLFADKPSLHSTWPGVTHVGLKMWGDKSWWTIHGKRLDESGFSLWHEGEPNNARGNEACGTFSLSDRTLNDVTCDLPYAFICEKHPDSLLNLEDDGGFLEVVALPSAATIMFSQEADGWLKLHRVPLNWHTARVQCYHEGAVLASPLNADLWSALTRILLKANLDYTLVYSGVSATFNDGVYSSVKGVPLGQLHFEWGKGQPNNLDGHEQCLAYCKESDKLTVPTHYWPEYTIQAADFHGALLQIPRARVAVASRRAGLSGRGRVHLLVSVFANKTSVHSIWPVASVGVKMWGDKSWWTIHGKRLDENGYSRGLEGMPNNYHRRKEPLCGSIYIVKKGTHDIPCDLPYAFCEKVKICEKLLASRPQQRR